MGGLNLYGYANGDPVNYADPFGLYAERQSDKGSIHDRLANAVRQDAKAAAGPDTKEAPSCRAVSFPGSHGTIHVQTNADGYVASGIYMHDSQYDYGPWEVDVMVNGKRVDGKKQSYPPHGSVNPRNAPPGSVVSFRATHLDYIGRPFRSVPNACIVPESGK